MLGLWEIIQTIKERPAQLLDAGKRELHLGLDASYASDTTP